MLVATKRKRQSLPWSEAEDAILAENFPLSSRREILCLLPRRTWFAIQQRANRKGFSRPAPRPWNSWSVADYRFLDENYGKIRTEELCLRLKRNFHAVNQVAWKRGLRMQRDKNGRTANSQNKPNLSALLRPTLEAFYWLGFLFADGHLNTTIGQLVLTCNLRDLGHLRKFASLVQGKLRVYKSTCDFTGKTKYTARIAVTDLFNAKKIAQKFDWNQRKTYFPPAPRKLAKAFVSDSQFLSFLCGFIDGDGSTYKWSVVVQNHGSWRKIHLFLLKRLSKIAGSPYLGNVFFCNRGYSILRFNVVATKFLACFVKTKPIPFLNRKWRKYEI